MCVVGGANIERMNVRDRRREKEVEGENIEERERIITRAKSSRRRRAFLESAGKKFESGNYRNISSEKQEKEVMVDGNKVFLELPGVYVFISSFRLPKIE